MQQRLRDYAKPPDDILSKVQKLEQKEMANKARKKNVWNEKDKN
jgi:hypothetical protein